MLSDDPASTRTHGVGVRSPATTCSRSPGGRCVPFWSGRTGSGVEGRGATPDRVYLDYAGFSPVDPRVLNVMRPFLEAGIGNPSAPHSLGYEARESLEAARAKVARLVGGGAPGVIFTSGATEANNLAIRGVAQRGGDKARHLVTSAVAISALNARRDFAGAGARCSPRRCGGASILRSCASSFALRLSSSPSAPSAGRSAPSSRWATSRGSRARQACCPMWTPSAPLGRVLLRRRSRRLDLVTVSSNDLYGPPGAGALWVRQGIKLLPQMLGGGQEGGYRSGTENLPALVGFGVAAELMRAEAGHGEPARLAALRKRLVDGLAVSIPECRLTGSSTARLPHHASFVLRGVKADGVLLDLDLCGVAASSGSACAQRTGTPSHVLRAIGARLRRLEGSLCLHPGPLDHARRSGRGARPAPSTSRACARSRCRIPADPHASCPLRHRRHHPDARGAGRRALAARSPRCTGRRETSNGTTFAAGPIRASSSISWGRRADATGGARSPGRLLRSMRAGSRRKSVMATGWSRCPASPTSCGVSTARPKRWWDCSPATSRRARASLGPTDSGPISAWRLRLGPSRPAAAAIAGRPSRPGAHRPEL